MSETHLLSHAVSHAAADARAAVCLAHAASGVSASLRRFGVRFRDEVAVVGLGSQGQLGVKLAKALGAQVTVLGLSASQREEARRLGADAFITLTGPEAFAAHAGRFRAILHAVPENHDDHAYAGLLQSEGLMLRLGAGDESPLLVA